MTIPFRSTVPSLANERASSLPFHWEAADRSLDALSGQVATFVRATIGGATIGANGGVAQTAHSQPQWESVLDPVLGTHRLGLLLNPPRTNRVLRSEDFSATWSDVGLPTVAIGRTLGDLTLTTLGDDAAGALEGKTQVITLSGNATKAVGVYVAKGAATSSVLRLRDTTAGANRLLAAITWSGETPSVAMTTGTFLGQRYLGEGVWELQFLSTSATAANTNQIEIYPATDAALATAATGTILVGGAWVFNLVRPGGYIKTTSSTAAADGDVLTWPFALPRRRVWLYLAFTELGSFAAPSSGQGYAAIGGISGTGLGFYPGFGVGYTAFHRVAGSGPSAALSGSFGTFGQFIELLATMGTDGTPTLTVARNGVEVGSQVGASAPADMTTAFSSSLIRLGAWDADPVDNVGGAAYHTLKAGEYGLGTPTMARVRGYR